MKSLKFFVVGMIVVFSSQLSAKIYSGKTTNLIVSLPPARDYTFEFKSDKAVDYLIIQTDYYNHNEYFYSPSNWPGGSPLYLGGDDTRGPGYYSGQSEYVTGSPRDYVNQSYSQITECMFNNQWGICRNDVSYSVDPPILIFNSVDGNDFSYTLAVSYVPEPQAWALMILGFGMAGRAMRRKQACGPQIRGLLRS